MHTLIFSMTNMQLFSKVVFFLHFSQRLNLVLPFWLNWPGQLAGNSERARGIKKQFQWHIFSPSFLSQSRNGFSNGYQSEIQALKQCEAIGYMQLARARAQRSEQTKERDFLLSI